MERKKDVYLRYHIRFDSKHNNSVFVLKNQDLAIEKAKQFAENGRILDRKTYVVEVKETVLWKDDPKE